ncbi:MAG: putative membrane protein SpoIIM required for sporulation [Planctomycetota bacterium]|jgi:uncharacterized membrane protein SpoIIM required for sporulation
MSRMRFAREREPAWKELELLLDDLERARSRREEEHASLPALYRGLCEDLSLARHRDYGQALEERLNQLALRGYHQLHGTRTGFLARALRFITVGIPRAVRAEARLMALCSLLFWGPFFTLLIAGLVAPEWVLAALPAEHATQLDDSFGGSSELGRSSSSNVAMFGHYIRNNITIDFRTYAGGLLCGVGALFLLIFNAVVMGAAFGYALLQGYGETLLRFTVGHGAPELWAVVLSAAGGMRLGLALLAPGRRTRRQALREDGRQSLRLAMGAAFMTSCAAFIEGFWSAQDFSLAVKLAFGVPLWIFVPLWLLLAGRRK